ncbi:tryptophan synthase subunit alpha [Alloiococcus sp. CFN-8]|uniref:tryptophan synthase subunit alpha n=1 Tax=Alloiococcus sp. CFN-8 TaxID=3416081 RepID=UPI003CF787FF
MKKLIIYLTLLYPNELEFFKILKGLDEAGVDIVELGIPVSNPHLDGEIVRESHNKVLANGLTVEKLKKALLYIRSNFSFKVVLMSYYEGVENFQLLKSGRSLCHGLLCVDKVITKEEFPDPVQLYNELMTSYEVEALTRENKLFAYVMSGVGKTGSFDKVPTGYMDTIPLIKRYTRLPVYVGFGIKTPKDVKNVCNNGADGVIIGSHYMKILRDEGIAESLKYVKTLKMALVEII